MVEVRLHGRLAQEFGQKWNFNIATPREAIDAIEANRPGIRKLILDLAAKGMVFRVRTASFEYDNDSIDMSLGRTKRIDFIPVVLGAGAGLRFVIGAVLVAVAFSGFLPAGATPYLASAGISLMLGSVVEWLTPVPRSSKQDSTKLDSWTVNGAASSAQQGSPVPLAYGEVLVPGTTVSAGLSVTQLSATAAQAPVVSIGGDTATILNTGKYGLFTKALYLRAGPFAISEPLTYSWTHSGFGTAKAVRFSGGSTATLRIEVDTPNITTQSIIITGSVSVYVTGKASDGSMKSASATSAVSLTVHTIG